MQWLRSFVVVAETGSMHRAASVLNVSPAAVSHHVRKLEEDVGVALFERKSDGMRLTEVGEQFRLNCFPLLRDMEDLRNFKERESILAGPIRLVCMNRLSHHLVFHILDFKKRHPAVQF